jgi:hypothetical protein
MFAEVLNSMSQVYSPDPRGENLLRQLYTYDITQCGIQFSENLGVPLTAIIDIDGKKRR